MRCPSQDKIFRFFSLRIFCNPLNSPQRTIQFPCQGKCKMKIYVLRRDIDESILAYTNSWWCHNMVRIIKMDVSWLLSKKMEFQAKMYLATLIWTVSNSTNVIVLLDMWSHCTLYSGGAGFRLKYMLLLSIYHWNICVFQKYFRRNQI